MLRLEHDDDEIRPRRKSAGKGNIFVESDVEDVDEAFEKPAKAKKETKKAVDEDADFQLAIELSKEDGNGIDRSTRRKSRVSFIEEEASESDDAFVEIEEELETDEDVLSDEDFEVEQEEKVEEKPKKGKKAVATTSKQAKQPAAPKPKAKTTKTPSTPATAKKSAPPVTKISRPTNFPAPSGVSLPGGGPRLRVGLSKRSAPRGPLSPVKIFKSS